MRTFQLLTALASTLPLTGAANSSFFQATALVTNIQNHTEIQCWQFASPLSVSSDAGTSGSATFTFSNTTETVYTVIPPRFNGGTHNAPAPQLVAFMSGLAHITLPFPVHGNSSLDEAWIPGGSEGLIVAVDTTGTGHITTYPLDQPTVALQIAFDCEDGIPAYKVASLGPCHFNMGAAQIV